MEVCLGVCLILYLLLGFVGRSIVDSYGFYHDVYLEEFALRKLDNTVAGIAFVISALCFAGAFLALFAKKLSYILKIIAGVHALQQGNYDHLVEVEGSNELTALAAGFFMFLLKNKLAKRIVFYASVALGVVLSAAGLYVAAVSALPFFVGVSVAGLILSIGALLLERFGKDQAKGFVLARVGSVAALALGLYSLYLW